jgi:polysaccharide export outer membrane protein
MEVSVSIDGGFMKHLILFASVVLAICFAGTEGAAIATQSPYVIHPGDQLLVSVYGESALTQTVSVLPDGYVELPLVGRVHVAGRTTEAAREMLARALRQYIRNPLVTVEVATQGQINALVLGDVKSPGKYALRSNAKLSDAIAAAGGLDSSVDGDLPTARVQNDGGPVETASLQGLLRDGDATQDVALADEAVVYVQSREPFSVEVIGAVDHPGDVLLHAGDRLSIAVAKAGNSAAAQSDLSHVYVSHKNPTGGNSTQEIDMYAALEHGNLAGDPKLQKGDVVFVPQARKPGTSGSSILNFIRLVLGI